MKNGSVSTAVAALVAGGSVDAAMNSNRGNPTVRANYNGYTATRPAILGLAKVIFLGLCQISFVTAAPVRTFLGIAKKDESPDVEDPELWLNLSIAAVLVLLGGTFAGLTIA